MRIAVLRALQLGDLLVAVPAWRALRAAYPCARITLVGLPWAASFVARFHSYLDELAEYPGRPVGYDLVLQMHGDGSTTNAIAERLGGRRTAGYALEAGPGFLRWDPRENEVLRWLRLVEAVGAPPRGTHLEFPLSEAERAQWRLSSYACVHPGSQLPSRRWPPERFAAIGDALAARGLQVVLTGTEPEAPITGTVARAMRSRALDLAGRTSLGGLAALIARARLVVCNDTSVSHIAAAFGTPSVVVASGSDPRRWAPLERSRHRVLHHEVACRPCMHRECPIGHPCALGVTTGSVMAEVSRMLACAA
jgi:ADP-heptose:LPS heptosyltransferase